MKTERGEMKMGRVMTRVMVAGLLVTLAGACAPAMQITRTQYIVSKSPYGRTPSLQGKPAKFRVGGAATLALLPGDESLGVSNGVGGGHLLPVGDAQFHVAAGLADFFELGIAGGFYFPETRPSKTHLPFEPESGALATLGLEARFLVPMGRVTLGFPLRVAAQQMTYAWTSRDVCTAGQCPKSLLEYKAGEASTFEPTFYSGMDLTASLSDRVRLIVGLGADLVPALPDQRQGTLLCTGGLCLDDRPLNPPGDAIEHVLVFVGYVGVEADFASWLRTRITVQPFASQPYGGQSYFLAQAALEFVLPTAAPEAW